MVDVLALDGTQITLGVIGLVGLALTGVIGPWITSRVTKSATAAKNAADTAVWTAAVMDEKIGTPNGRGNVVEMLERLDERTEGTHRLLLEHLKRYDLEHPHR